VNFNLVYLKVMGELARCDLQSINQFHDVEIPSLRVAQYFTDEVDQLLDLAVGTRLPSFDDDRRTNHIACSQYAELQGFMWFRGHQGGWGSQVFLEIFESIMYFFGPLELVLLFE
jgi:hypothetical protein